MDFCVKEWGRRKELRSRAEAKFQGVPGTYYRTVPSGNLIDRYFNASAHTITNTSPCWDSGMIECDWWLSRSQFRACKFKLKFDTTWEGPLLMLAVRARTPALVLPSYVLSTSSVFVLILDLLILWLFISLRSMTQKKVKYTGIKIIR